MHKSCFLVLWLGTAAATGAAEHFHLDQRLAAAEGGDVGAMFELGLAYDAGTKVPKDPQQAARWYLAAAEAGFAPAQNSIGTLYQEGAGVPRDYERARHWFRQAAEQDDPQGQHNLGFLLDEGLGTPEDNAQAIALYQAAADQGFVRSMLNLGISHASGDGVEADLVEAWKWLDLARLLTQHSDDMALKWTARDALDSLKRQLSRQQIAAGRKRAREWLEAHRPP